LAIPISNSSQDEFFVTYFIRRFPRPWLETASGSG